MFDPTDAGTEPPLLFDVPLPQECTVGGTQAHSYNQGLCSRKPCRTKEGECSVSKQCCYEVGQTANVDFVCSDTSIPNRGHVIVMCHCQLCSQLHAQVRGKVFSSFQREPVILAAVVVGSEIATFTDQDGSFWFETLTTSSELTMIFQETRHRELEKVIQVRPSLTHELTVVLEYIEHRDCVHKLEAGFDVALASESTTETYGIDGFLHFHLTHSPTLELTPIVVQEAFCTLSTALISGRPSLNQHSTTWSMSTRGVPSFRSSP